MGDPTFYVQETFWMQQHSEPMIGLTCQLCGHINAVTVDYVREMAGLHVGCPKCMVVATVPDVEVMAP